MSISSQVVHEIRSVTSFFQSRHSEANNDTLQMSFADTLIMMLKSIKEFGPADAALINNAMSDTPYGTEQTARISACMDALLTKSGKRADAQAVPRGAADKQSLKFWWFYMTASDMAVVRDPRKRIHAKMCTLAERGMKLGVIDPDEQSFKRLLAMLLICHYDELPAAQLIYDKLQDLKHTWSAEKRIVSVERLSTYPETPSLLSPALFADAYAGDDPPVSTQLAGVCRVAECIPLRNNSKLLKAKGKGGGSQQRDTCGAAFAASQQLAETRVPAPSAAGDGHTPVKEDSVDDEEVLRLEYELKLAKLRAAKGFMASMAQPVGVGGSTLRSPSSAAASPSCPPHWYVGTSPQP